MPKPLGCIVKESADLQSVPTNKCVSNELKQETSQIEVSCF